MRTKSKTKELIKLLDEYYSFMEKVKKFVKDETGDEIDIEINLIEENKIEKRPLSDEFEILLRGK